MDYEVTLTSGTQTASAKRMVKSGTSSGRYARSLIRLFIVISGSSEREKVRKPPGLLSVPLHCHNSLKDITADSTFYDASIVRTVVFRWVGSLWWWSFRSTLVNHEGRAIPKTEEETKFAHPAPVLKCRHGFHASMLTRPKNGEDFFRHFNASHFMYKTSYALYMVLWDHIRIRNNSLWEPAICFEKYTLENKKIPLLNIGVLKIINLAFLPTLNQKEIHYILCCSPNNNSITMTHG